jgi:glycosyltransferase involved in cell wall biosynthesis
MLKIHRERDTWGSGVEAFIALTEFARIKLTACGFPSERVFVKPNFVEHDPGERTGLGDSVLFVGRLSPEKGVGALLDAWRLLKRPLPLKIIGDGPERNDLESQAIGGNLKNVEFLGRLSGERTREEMKRSRFLIVPSLWYEGFPMVIAEAFACGLPVVGSRLGAMQEVIDDGMDGLHFVTGSSEDLASKAAWAWEHPEKMAEMGRNARFKYEESYRPERNYSLLMEIYEKAASKASRRSPVWEASRQVSGACLAE